MIRVRPEVAADWLVRTLLPALLPMCGHTGLATILREEQPPVDSLRDRYAMARLETTLRAVAAELVERLRVEVSWGRREGVRRTVVEFGGSTRFRAICFPQLDAVTEFVATSAAIGGLLRACVEGTIELVVARHDNDRVNPDTPPTSVLAPLMWEYDRALQQLLQRQVSPPPGPPPMPGHDPRCRAEPVRRATSRRAAFRGVFESIDGDVRCPHAHKTSRTARDCARELARRADAETAVHV